MIPGVNQIAVNKYMNINININIKLCRPVLRNILLEDDQFTHLHVISKINYIYVCMYSVFRRTQDIYASKVASVSLFTHFFHMSSYV
jgi:hypothetical protein